MARWKIEYYPSHGERYSPSDFIDTIENIDDIANIKQRLQLIADYETSEWPRWVKLIKYKKKQKIYQLTYGDYRIYFQLDGDILIVVCHGCRKVSQKAREQDLSRACENWARYNDAKGTWKK